MSLYWILLELGMMEGGGGDSWNYKMNKAPVKLVTTNKPNTQLFTGQMPSCHPTNSVKARKGI